MRDHFPKENARFAQQTVSKKCQDGIFEIGCSPILNVRCTVRLLRRGLDSLQIVP